MGSVTATQPSFPRKRESRTALPYNVASLSSNRRIPAYAGMTVGGANPGGDDGREAQTTGNDGRGAQTIGNDDRGAQTGGMTVAGCKPCCFLSAHPELR